MRNTKSLLAIFLACMMVMSCIVAVPVVAATEVLSDYVEPTVWSTWDGTAVDDSWYNTTDTSFTLDTAAKLAGLAKIVNAETDTFKDKTIVLGADIDLAGKEWTPIGEYSSTAGFRGTFDGANKTVKGLTITTANAYNALFGVACGTIKDLYVLNADVAAATTSQGIVVGRAYGGGTFTMTNVNVINSTVAASAGGGTGILFGRNDSFNNITVTDCDVKESTINASGKNFVGAVLGYGSGTVSGTFTITDCDIDATITGGPWVGGLIGATKAIGTLSISNCTVAGSVTGTSSNGNVGGLVGLAGYGSTTVTAISASGCEVTADVSGVTNVGGMIGANYSSTSITLTDCTLSGSVSGSSVNVGGMIGSVTTASTVSVTGATLANTASVTGSKGFVGGMIGYVDTADSVSFEDSSSYATISAGSCTAAETPYNSAGCFSGIFVGSYKTGELNVTNCVASGSIEGGARIVGGFFGGTTGAIDINISGSLVSATITGTANRVGGFVGALTGGTSTLNGTLSVKDSMYTGTVSGTTEVGALLGSAVHNSYAIDVDNTAVLGTITATSDTGTSGIVAGNYAKTKALAETVTITSLYHNTNITSLGNFSGTSTSGTTAEDNVVEATYITPNESDANFAKTNDYAITDFVSSFKAAASQTSWYANIVCNSCNEWVFIAADESEDTLTCDKLCSNAMVLTNDPVWGGTYDVAWYIEAGADAESYTIDTAEELAGLAKIVAGVAKDADGAAIAADTFEGQTIVLGKNLKLNSDEEIANIANWGAEAPTNKWFPIGNYDNANLAGAEKADWMPFRGTFDGNNKTITGLYVDGTEVIANSKTLYYTGLFGTAGAVSNLTIKDAYVVGGSNATGVVAGCPRSETPNFQNVDVINGTAVSSNTYGLAILMGTVGTYGNATYTDCDIEGTLGTTDTRTSNVGAVIGYANTTLTNASVSNCTTDCTIYGAGNVGGLFGTINYAATALTISDTTVNGTVDGTEDNVGGIIGNLVKADAATIENTQVAADVSAASYVGGLIGNVSEATTIDIVKSAITQDATIKASAQYAGGLVGYATTVTTLNVKGSSFAGAVNTPYTTSDPKSGGLFGTTNNVATLYIGAYTDPETSAKTNTTVAGSVTTGRGRTGGVIGSAEGTSNITIEDTNVSTAVTGWLRLGGMIGVAQNTGTLTVKNSTFTGSIGLNKSDANNYYGGILGELNSSACEFSTDNVKINADINGGKTVGGVIGHITVAKTVIIYNTDIKGTIAADGAGSSAVYVGGIIGTGAATQTYSLTVEGVSVTATITTNTTGNSIIAGVFSQVNSGTAYPDITIKNCYIKPASITATKNYSAGLLYTHRSNTLTLGNNVVLGTFTQAVDISSNVTGTVTVLEGTKVYVDDTTSKKFVTLVTINDEAVVDFANVWGTATANYTVWSACSNCEGSGWIEKANAADGQYRVSCVDMCKGVTAEARSVSVVALGGSVRYLDPFGVRFGGRVYGAAEGSEYGVLMIPTTMLNGAELTVDNADALKIKAEKTFPSGEYYVNGAATFTGVVYDIPDTADAYDTQLTAVVYYTVDGVTYYSNVMTASYYDVAKLILADADWVAANSEAAATLQAVVDLVDAQ